MSRGEPTRLSYPVDKLAVVDVANRNVDLLKMSEEMFIVRDTQHALGDNTVGAQNIWLDRDELGKLRDRIEQMLADRVGKRRSS